MSQILDLSVVDFLNQFEKEENAILVDTRKPEEVEQGAIKGAIVINFLSEDFANKILKLEKSKPYFVYCRSGRRSKEACQAMNAIGIKSVFNLDGGYLAYLENENKQ